VTRLGEFSPILGDYSFCAILLKIAEVALIWGLLFRGKWYVLILSKNWLGFLFGDFSQTHLGTLQSKHEKIIFNIEIESEHFQPMYQHVCFRPPFVLH
jgi:hypothetical protein